MGTVLRSGTVEEKVVVSDLACVRANEAEVARGRGVLARVGASWTLLPDVGVRSCA